VVAAWVPGEGNQRWYVIPDATGWNGILDWLIHRALPSHLPNALRRARSPHFTDPSLQTEAEAAAREALGALKAGYVEEKARLEDELRRASDAADRIRYGLLYGTGSELVQAVACVLEQAGQSARAPPRRGAWGATHQAGLDPPPAPRSRRGVRGFRSARECESSLRLVPVGGDIPSDARRRPKDSGNTRGPVYAP
jgi:hypothetical protein